MVDVIKELIRLLKVGRPLERHDIPEEAKAMLPYYLTQRRKQKKE